MTSSRGAERAAASRLAFWIRYLIFLLLASFVLAEATARLITETTPSGLLRTRFREIALLPLRPTEAVVRRALDAFSRDRFLETDGDLGWNLRRNQSEGKDHTNALGFRAEPDFRYPALPPDGKVRIMTLGDSYVYCSQVRNDETWQAYLEGLRDDVEVLNLGLPGAGTDQAFLRWRRDGKPFWSQLVVLGIWPDNVFRNLAIVDYYRTTLDLAFTKPRLVLDASGAPRFVNAPIMSRAELALTLTHPETNTLLEHDFWFDPRDATAFWYRRIRVLQMADSVWWRYQRKLTYKKLLSGEIPDAIEVSVAIAKLFAAEVRAAGSIPLVLVIPDRERLALGTEEQPFPLIQRIRDEQIGVIDMGPTFGHEVMTNGPAEYYVDGIGHQSPYGNRIFARYLEQELRPWIEQANSLSRPAQPPGRKATETLKPTTQ